MSAETDTFVDPEEGLRELFLAEIDDIEARQIGEFPADNPTGMAYYIAVETIGGPRDYFQDSPLIDIDVFANSRALAKSVSETVSDLLLGYPKTVLVEGRRFTIDRVGVVRRPVKEPWDDENVRRQGATYQLTVRR